MASEEEIKISFEFKERFLLRQLFPQQSDLLTQLLIRDISEKVDVSQKETLEAELQHTQTGTTWNPQKAKGKDVLFTVAEFSFLNSQVGRLDKEKKITSDLLSICLKIRDWKAEDKKTGEDNNAK